MSITSKALKQNDELDEILEEEDDDIQEEVEEEEVSEE